jgi:hypothetical protein
MSCASVLGLATGGGFVCLSGGAPWGYPDQRTSGAHAREARACGVAAERPARTKGRMRRAGTGAPW